MQRNNNVHMSTGNIIMLTSNIMWVAFYIFISHVDTYDACQNTLFDSDIK